MYPDLHQATVELATAGAVANRRRRTDILNACKSLDDLRAGLLKEGNILSQQAIYVYSLEELITWRESNM